MDLVLNFFIVDRHSETLELLDQLRLAFLWRPVAPPRPFANPLDFRAQRQIPPLLDV